MKRLIFLMLCMLPWLSYAQNEQTPQEQLVSLMKNYYRSDINNIQALLDAGASFDVKDKYGRTPIFYLRAPEFNLAELFELYPIDLTVSDNDGYTVYEYLLKMAYVLESKYTDYSLKFMNFMEEHNAVYDTNKILFLDKSWFSSGKWHRYVGKNIPGIKNELERLNKEQQTTWWKIYDIIQSGIDFISEPGVWIVLILVIIMITFIIFVISGFFYIIWLVLSGRLFKILKYIKRKTDKKDM